ncbi:hypothetical protein NP569_23410, partial [Vibrio parahaemolyticus]|nr:hypothetical protein [Vibrio parahaemolyticus]
SSASLTVDDRHLLYGNGLVDSLPQPENNENYQVSSQRFPFTAEFTIQVQQKKKYSSTRI